MIKKNFLFGNLLVILCFSILGCSKTHTNSQDNSSTTPSEPVYSIERPSFDGDFTTYKVDATPSGFNMTYYSDIYSRGFSWITDDTVNDTKLYLVESDKGEKADFSAAEAKDGETVGVKLATSGTVTFADNSYPSGSGSSNSSELNINSHKVHVENLKKGQAYSYKVGSESGWKYGAFIVEKENPETITAVHMSDAQTKDPSKLNVWRNTFTHSVETAGSDLDFALYNGDQFDQNMDKINNVRQIRFATYSKALDVIADYKADIPYMTSSGNHEPSAPYSQFLHSDIKYPENGVAANGTYYSFDYKFAHFAVLNTNTVDDKQINWLKADLDVASSAKWKIVMMHISPYSTGDHSVKSENETIAEKLTPVFSSKHVDLVLQAHDHTYNKTLPYKWDAAGYTTTWNNSDVVNLAPETEQIGEITYDKNPQGTYYVTTASAGHRVGAPEASDGIYAEVIKNEKGEFEPLNSSKTYQSAKYKTEMGKIKYDNQYEPYTVSGKTSDQHYEVGDLATGCVNAQMFGVLNLTATTLTYAVYSVNDNTVKLFDSLDVLKA